MVSYRKSVDGISPYVPGKPIEEVKRELGLTHIVKLASNENPLGPSPLAIQAMKDYAFEMNLYPDGNSFALKAALSAKFHVCPEEITLGTGGDEILRIVAETFLSPGDEILVPAPTFSQYTFVAQIVGATIHTHPLKNDFSYDIEGILSAITDKTRMVFVCTPNNPTGGVLSRGDLEILLDKMPKDVVLLLDEAYYEFADHTVVGDGFSYINEHDNLLVLRTFSKAYGMAGLRVGYMVGDRKLIALMEKVRGPFNVNRLAQYALLASLEDQDHVAATIKNNEIGKEALYEAFDRLSLPYIKTHANFIFVDTKRDAVTVFNALLQEGVIVRSGHVFGFPTYLRITVGLPEENDFLLRALHKVLPTIDEIKS